MKKPVTNEYTGYDSIYVKFKNKQNLNMAIETMTMVPYGGLEGGTGELLG